MLVGTVSGSPRRDLRLQSFIRTQADSESAPWKGLRPGRMCPGLSWLPEFQPLSGGFRVLGDPCMRAVAEEVNSFL